MGRFSIILVLFMCSIASDIYGQQYNSHKKAESRQESEQDNKELDKKLAAKPSQLLAHMAERMNLDGEGLRHIRKHLIDVAGHGHLDDVLDIGEGDHTKGIFYFFRLHDDDNNQKLDGLEWLKALTHFHEGDKGDKDLMESEAITIIDELLENHDNDKDGMIDFAELMNTKLDSVMNELNREQQQQQQGHHQQQHQQKQDQQDHDQQQQDQQQQHDQHQQQQQDQQ
ncbi:SUN domain-containing protein 2-like, partial [Actinia tenebrosa]|uniref:SUN domain-containing protein 2-like n=1 Tax=Actinia tenebrosa TaxID=6105 RepID=A0A6P8H0H2_ACTTE